MLSKPILISFEDMSKTSLGGSSDWFFDRQNELCCWASRIRTACSPPQCAPSSTSSPGQVRLKATTLVLWASPMSSRSIRATCVERAMLLRACELFLSTSKGAAPRLRMAVSPKVKLKRSSEKEAFIRGWPFSVTMPRENWTSRSSPSCRSLED